MQKRVEVTLMDKQTDPNDFLVVLPGEIIVCDDMFKLLVWDCYQKYLDK